MEEKTKKAWMNIVKYVRELSVVVVGIAITFTASDLISDRNEQKDLKRYLDAVKLELEENIEVVKEKGEFYKRSIEFGDYLRSHKQHEASLDTIRKYSDITGHIFFLNYKTSAFDMLKASGAMRLIKNKALLTAILNSYNMLEETKSDSDMYINKKTDELFKSSLDNEEVFNDLRSPKHKRLYAFYSIPFDIEDIFNDCKIQIEETLTLFH